MFIVRVSQLSLILIDIVRIAGRLDHIMSMIEDEKKGGDEEVCEN